MFSMEIVWLEVTHAQKLKEVIMIILLAVIVVIIFGEWLYPPV